MKKLLKELKRRHVIRLAGIYIVGGWVVLQVSDVVVPALGAPAWWITLVLYLLILGFPFAVLLSWKFDLTRKGITQDETDAVHQRFRPGSPVVLLSLALFLSGTLLAWRLAQPPQLEFLSLAVLPLVNLTGDAEQEYRADGITEEILNQLFRLPDLKVIARTSVFELKSKNLSLSQIGQQLDVAKVLEGTLQMDGAAMRVALRLVEVATGEQLWAETFSGQQGSFEFQDQITASVAQAVAGVAGQAPPPPARLATREALAREHFQRGRYYFEQRGEENLQKAEDYFQKAIDVDPLYADAWAGLGQSYMLKFDPRAIAATERALEFDPDNPRALILSSSVAWSQDWDFSHALEQAQRAVTAAPGDGDVRHFHAIVLGITGQFESALAESRIAAELNPLYPPLLEGIGHRLRYLWRYEEAIDLYRQSVANGMKRTRDQLFFAYGWMGRVDEAKATLLDISGGLPLDHWDRMALAYFGGDKTNAASIYTGQLKASLPDASEGNLSAIQTAAFGNDLDYAFTALNAAAEQKQVTLVRMLRSRLPEEMYADPRWLEFWQHPNMASLFEMYRAAGDAPWLRYLLSG